MVALERFQCTHSNDQSPFARSPNVNGECVYHLEVFNQRKSSLWLVYATAIYQSVQSASHQRCYILATHQPAGTNQNMWSDVSFQTTAMLLDTSSTWAAVPVRMPSGDDPTHYTSSLSPLDPTYETLGAFINRPLFITCLLTNQLHLARPHNHGCARCAEMGNTCLCRAKFTAPSRGK